MAEKKDMKSSVKMLSKDLGRISVANRETARRKRRRKFRAEAIARVVVRLRAIIPLQFTQRWPLKNTCNVAKAMICYIHTVNGKPNTAEKRYQDYIARLGCHNTKKALRALAELIPGKAVSERGQLGIVRAAYKYAAILQEGEPRAEGSVAIKTEEGGASKNREQRDLQEGNDSDDVEYLATYDVSKRSRLPKPEPQAELTLQFKVEEGHTVSQSDKHYISISLGRMKSKSLSEVAVIVRRSASQFVDSFMDGAFPDIGPLPDHVVGEVLTFAKACVPPESLRSMMVTKAREGSHEDNDAMDIDDPEETTSSSKKRSSTHSARTGSKTSFVMIDELQRDLKGLQAALRASGRDQDDIEEYLNKIAHGKKPKIALVEMGWKTA